MASSSWQFAYRRAEEYSGSSLPAKPIQTTGFRVKSLNSWRTGQDRQDSPLQGSAEHLGLELPSPSLGSAETAPSYTSVSATPHPHPRPSYTYLSFCNTTPTPTPPHTPQFLQHNTHTHTLDPLYRIRISHTLKPPIIANYLPTVSNPSEDDRQSFQLQSKICQPRETDPTTTFPSCFLNTTTYHPSHTMSCHHH